MATIGYVRVFNEKNNRLNSHTARKHLHHSNSRRQRICKALMRKQHHCGHHAQETGTSWLGRLVYPKRNQRAKFFMGAEDKEGVNSLTFSSLGIAFNVDYTADKKFTLKMISGGSGEYSCKVM